VRLDGRDGRGGAGMVVRKVRVGRVVGGRWVGLILPRMRKVGIMRSPSPFLCGAAFAVSFDASNNP
jgi:hypothetical protein